MKYALNTTILLLIALATVYLFVSILLTIGIFNKPISIIIAVFFTTFMLFYGMED